MISNLLFQPYRRLRSFAAIFAVLFVFACLTIPAHAQQTLGSLNGTVLDTSGAAIPAATITVHNSQTGLERTSTSQQNGFFQIFNLPIGSYDVKVTHDGFDTTELPSITIQEASATTINVSLKVGHVSTSVTVEANPLLNATDTTNGYTMDKQQIALTPLATGSFTQLAVLAPGVNAELLSGLDTNAGLGNQPIWANGQRDTSNTFHVNGVDVSNLFNGKSSSGDTSQRYNFNIGGGSTSSSSTAGAATVGGANPTGTSVYGSNGNSLPSPPPEFITELRVNTSMYDAQQGATSGAQVDVNTATGSNGWHGQVFGSFANNALNASPFFFNQSYQLATQGVGAFPHSLVNPDLHRWTTGATLGGPIKKDKLFFFVGYQRLYSSDQSTGLSQFNVPSFLTDDRSTTGLTNDAMEWNGGSLPKGWSGIGPVASAIMNAKLPNGQYLIPSAQTSAPYAYGVPNVTLIGTSLMTGDQATAAVDYNVNNRDHMSVKYYYQNVPVNKPFNVANTYGFPQTQENGSQVAALDNTISFGSKVNWEQTVGFARMGSYSYYQQQVNSPSGDPTFGISSSYPLPNGGSSTPGNFLPGLLLKEFAFNSSVSPGVKVGPYSAFTNMGYYQNRVNPSTNLILALGKHTLSLGGGYSYTQLNIVNNRNGIANITTKNFDSFLQDQSASAGVLDTIGNGRNLANRYYRANELAGYAQDKWQILSNLSITAGVRYDYHAGMTEKYGNMFNFDPAAYSVSGNTTSGFTVNNSGFVVAGNNKYNPTSGVSDSTLSGRQWGISPRVGFAWAPKQNDGKVVFNGGFGLYYDRGELFSYFSQPAGSTTGGPFGVTESSPLATYISAGKGGLGTPLASPSSYVPPSANPAVIAAALQNQLNIMTGDTPPYGKTCGAVANQEVYADCTSPLNFGAYDKNNVLPYTMNFNFAMQWQPSSDLAIKIGYTGNRGRHAVIPIPFNEPGIATPSHPINGEQYSYGFQVLNQNTSAGPEGYDYASIANENWNTPDGGNTDYRVPFIGYSPNAAYFETVGTSAYDALETHIEKRLSHNFQAGASYTFSKTLDEQSDIGLFFTGSNPNDLKSSYAPSDFDRTHVFSANFQVLVPNAARANTLLSYFTNDWHLNGIGILQSGEPYSLYEFYGAVGSIYFGSYPTLLNPVLGIKDPAHPKNALTGNSGAMRGPGGSFIPAIDPSQIDIHYLQPGEKGIPVSTGSDPQDIYETDFAPGQRNLFRQSAQKRLDISVRKAFIVKSRWNLEYQFNVFNITNTTSLDVPQNQTQIRQSYACSATAQANPYGNCALDYVNYSQIVTSNKTADQQSALAALDQIPAHNGTGRGITIPTTLPVLPQTACSYATLPTGNGCPNNGANFGSVTGTIGGPRVVTMGLRLEF